MSISDWELWSCANHVLSTHGENAQQHVSGQIDALEANGDDEGIRTWQEIARRIAFLAAGELAPGTRH